MIKEIWKDIPDYLGFYQISNLGRVKSLARTILRDGNTPIRLKEKILSLRIGSKGYCRCALIKDGLRKEFKTHRLVAYVFLGLDILDPSMMIDHKDFDKTNNSLQNIRVVDARTNSQHKEKNINCEFSSSFIGVYRRHDNKKWCANIGLKNKTIYIGSFASESEAAKAYNEECLKIGATPPNKI